MAFETDMGSRRFIRTPAWRAIEATGEEKRRRRRAREQVSGVRFQVSNTLRRRPAPIAPRTDEAGPRRDT